MPVSTLVIVNVNPLSRSGVYAEVAGVMVLIQGSENSCWRALDSVVTVEVEAVFSGSVLEADAETRWSAFQ